MRGSDDQEIRAGQGQENAPPTINLTCFFGATHKRVRNYVRLHKWMGMGNVVLRGRPRSGVAGTLVLRRPRLFRMLSSAEELVG